MPTVDGLPVVLVEPTSDVPRRPLVLWLTHLGGSKEQTRPMLEAFAAAGHPAISFDPPGHGERGDGGDPWQLAERVLGSFRRLMWPLLAQTTLESLRVLDWAAAQLGHDGEVHAGGVSMGGDVSVALAGIDERVTRVAAAVATPDWARPGMRQLANPDELLDQGAPDRYASWLREQLDPMLNLDGYARGPAITFECADGDVHVPPDGAERFKEALFDRYPAAGERIAVNRHPGVGHLDGARDPGLLDACRRWLLEPG
jgi:pimeloyl-ACP methyl ester carboxylesterase